MTSINDDELLNELNKQSGFKMTKKLTSKGFKRKLSLNWLKKEICRELTPPKEKNDVIAFLRAYRQKFMLWRFWQEFWTQHPDNTCLSFKLQRLLAKIEKEEPTKVTLFMLDEFRLDYGSSGISRFDELYKRVQLKWEPRLSEKIHVFIAVEPNSWQNFELSEEDSTKTESQTMTCFLGTKYRSCPEIDVFVRSKFIDESELPLVMSGAKQSELSMRGQVPLWISTRSLEEDKEALFQILKEETNDYSNDVIWTCSPASDFGKCKLFCQEGWVYVNINHMDGIEAALVVIFGIPPEDGAFGLLGHTKLSRLLTRARNSLILITEEDPITREKNKLQSCVNNNYMRKMKNMNGSFKSVSVKYDGMKNEYYVVQMEEPVKKDSH